MLSTQYRLRLESICKQIVDGENVKLDDMIWAQKLAKRNTTAATWMRQARQKAANPDMKKGGTDDFLNKMGLENPTHRIIETGSIVQMTLVNGLTERNLTIGDNETNGKLVPRPTDK